MAVEERKDYLRRKNEASEIVAKWGADEELQQKITYPGENKLKKLAVIIIEKDPTHLSDVNNNYLNKIEVSIDTSILFKLLY